MANKRLRQRGSGTRKYGRNEAWCQVYRSERKREKSHIRKITKHIQSNPKDRQAKKALVKYKGLL